MREGGRQTAKSTYSVDEGGNRMYLIKTAALYDRTTLNDHALPFQPFLFAVLL